MLSCLPNLIFRFVSYYFLFVFLPWVGRVGLECSDRFSVLTLSHPCTAESFSVLTLSHPCAAESFSVLTLSHPCSAESFSVLTLSHPCTAETFLMIIIMYDLLSSLLPHW